MNYSLEDSIKEQIDKFGCPNIVIHAGWGGMTSPMSDHHLRENVCNGKILIDTLYSNGLEKFIFLGSVNEYGSRSGILQEDMQPVGSLITYAKGKTEVAKYGFEAARHYSKTFINPRVFYVYGAGQRGRSLINELYNAFIQQREVNISSCKHYRDYIYVDDVVEGIIRLSGIEISSTVNLGSGSYIQVRDFVKMFWHRLGGPPNRLKFGNRSMYEGEPVQIKSYADLTNISKLVNWKPNTSLENGIESTIKELQQ